MDIQQVQRLVAESGNIVFFGGAGTSTESGIPDFRSAGGLFGAENEEAGYSPEEILSRDCFLNRTELFYRFYFKHMIHRHALPNPAHHALAELERQGKLKAVITQNIDGLHQMAGSREVLELHGSVHRNYCMDCRAFYDLDAVLEQADAVPTCRRCGGVIKPDVVLYQEHLDDGVLQRAVDAIAAADVLIVAGTSLRVYPAAGLIRHYTGNRMILINKTPTSFDGAADVLIQDSIGKVLRALVRPGEA